MCRGPSRVTVSLKAERQAAWRQPAFLVSYEATRRGLGTSPIEALATSIIGTSPGKFKGFKMTSTGLIRAGDVLVPCVVLNGGFPSERVFRIADRLGVAPKEYFWKDENTPLEDDPVAEKGISGFVKGRVVGGRGTGKVSVHLPSGDVLSVSEANLL